MKEETKLKRIMHKLENNMFFIVLTILMASYFAFSKFIKATNDNREIIFQAPPNQPPKAKVKNDTLYKIEGIVIDINKNPISKVKIELKSELEQFFVTNNTGEFQIDFIRNAYSPRVISMFFHHNDFFSAEHTIKQFNSSSIQIGSIVLKKKTAKQKKIVREKNNESKNKNKISTEINNNGNIGNVITGEEIKIEIKQQNIGKSDSIKSNEL